MSAKSNPSVGGAQQQNDFFSKPFIKEKPDLSQPWSTTAEGQKAEAKLRASPYDLDSWGVLIREAQNQHIYRFRELFEKLVTQFPTCGKFWKTYIEHEMQMRNYDRVEKLFPKCLRKVLHIDLWKCYINYVKETKRDLSSYREKLSQTYDFALDNVGLDMMSASIWQDYVQFLKASEGHGTIAESQKIAIVRKIYQKAVTTPLQNVDSLWKAYSEFEMSLHPGNAKKLLDDKNKLYNAARRAAKFFENEYKSLNKSTPPVPPSGSTKELQQIELWKSYINWEKDNSILPDVSLEYQKKRVIFAYEQCLLVFPYHAHIWYEAAKYIESCIKLMTEKGEAAISIQWADEVATWYERAISNFLPDCLLLYFAYADYEEGRMKYDKVHQIYSKALENSDLDPSLVYVQYMKFVRRVDGIIAARGIFKRARNDTRCQHHVFAASALMEYFSSKDTQTAVRIFDHGLKKFGSESSYALTYIDFLTHLNDENNSRVLFEKVLASVAPEKSAEIWDKFYDFENNVGDLTSLLKVEQRRADVLPETVRDKDSLILVDRYKYIDLYPCSENELKAMKYQTKAASTSTTTTPAQIAEIVKTVSVSGPASISEIQLEPHIYQPDVTQMRAYKPFGAPGVGLLTHAGGVVPIPEACTHILSRLPPPNCFTGPFVIADELIRRLVLLELPLELDRDFGVRSIDVLRYEDKPRSNKRNHSDVDSSEPPDIYKSRQKMKVNLANDNSNLSS